MAKQFEVIYRPRTANFEFCYNYNEAPSMFLGCFCYRNEHQLTKSGYVLIAAAAFIILVIVIAAVFKLRACSKNRSSKK